MQAPIHPRLTRRTALQAGAVGILGLGTNHLSALRAASPAGTAPARAGMGRHGPVPGAASGFDQGLPCGSFSLADGAPKAPACLAILPCSGRLALMAPWQ